MMTRDHMQVLSLLLLGVLLQSTLCHGWFLRNRESSKEHYCDASLDDMVSRTCHETWYTSACEGCRNRRDLTEQEAKSFLAVSHSRRKRAVWSLREECCHEGCSDHEVLEHC